MTVLLQLRDLTKTYGTRTIFEDVVVSFSEYQKIGVIGRNGAGKSTLFKLIVGLEEADSGAMIRNSNLRLAYLEQHDPFEPEELVMAFLERYTGEPDWECAKALAQVKIPESMHDDPLSTLSGGYQTRVKLAAIILQDPNLVLLDEPTNYLDLTTLMFLESFLIDFPVALMVISHDREFLRRTCDHTLEVENNKVMLFPGDIDTYLSYKAEMVAQIEKSNKVIEAKQEQLQAFVDRFRSKASKASQAQSKLKQLQKLKTVEIDGPSQTASIKMPTVIARKGMAMESDALQIGYPERTIARNIELYVQRGTHVAIVGDNGQGKTTLLRTIAGDISPLGGSFRWGHECKIAYYAQHVFQVLPDDEDVFSYLMKTADISMTRQDVLNMAGSFLFSGDEVKKKIGVLSGGERSRVVLAQLLLSKSDVFLLDEPTNHLDFETVEALARALKSFNGTVFFISHDRTFVEFVATAVIEVKNGTVRHFPGTYDDYVYSIRQSLEEPKKDVISVGNVFKSKKNQKKNEASLKSKMKKVEAVMGKLNQEKADITGFFERHPTDFDLEKANRLTQVETEIAEKEAIYLEILSLMEGSES